MKMSPMMQHYVETKKNYEDCVLFYRLGDFYEMFFEDAKTVSKELELTLTGKSCGLEEKAPMCGVPYHASETYIAKLVEKGYKVAICEQVEDPAEAKGIVKREVVKIITPGTVTSGTMLNEKDNNYIASIYADVHGISICYCDISTGEFKVTEDTQSTKLYKNIINQLVSIAPKEIILNEAYGVRYSISELKREITEHITVFGDNYFSLNASLNIIEKQFGSGSAGFMGLSDKENSLRASGGLLTYLMETQKQALSQITRCIYFDIDDSMVLDRATLKNLEITETLYENKIQGSLLGVLDKTKTAMGSRKLKRILRSPLNKVENINLRLDAVEEIISNPLVENNFRSLLADIYDFERLAGRIASGNANGRDLIALKSSLKVLPEIKNDLTELDSELLKSIASSIHTLEDVTDLIENSIKEDTPPTISEGGIIKSGYSDELDSLKFSIKDAKEWIASLDVKERERTGIKNLKVGYNKVFGYYIDIPRSASESVPEEYIRKQTLVNNERFITPELKEMEGLVLNAETKINKLEYEIFTDIRKEINGYIEEIQETSDVMAMLDVICTFSYVSKKNGYVKPHMNDSYEITIEKGRHPVIEQTDDYKMFVSNDTYLDGDSKSLSIITGPNMAGKSTYMRQNALIVLMAQIGCFVPADMAKIGVVDRIFTRIGASDNLSKGQSTFYVEMSELAYILSSATDRSLIILDEIGRGTSTYDGLAIAWATAEHLCNEKNHIRTLFATHYHELTSLEEQNKRIMNLNVDVADDNGEIIFLHKIVPGSASKSYGIHVAKIAGAPKSLLESAEEKLSFLERDNKDSLNNVKGTVQSNKRSEEENKQLSFFTSMENDAIIKRIKNIDIMEISASKALELLEELQDAIK